MPFKPRERQYRSFSADNIKPVAREDAHDGDDSPSYRVRGYFTTFSQEYLMYPAMPSLDMPAEYEQIDPHAFDGCDLSDVIVQYDHCGDVLARTRNRSLVIGFDEHGGWCEMYLGGCQRARDLYESICNGLIAEMSFGFVIADDADGFGMTKMVDEDGTIHWTVTRISKMFDASIVSIPANGNTSVEEVRKRSLTYAIIEAERRKADEAKAQEREAARADAESRSRRRRRARALKLQEL